MVCFQATTFSNKTLPRTIKVKTENNGAVLPLAGTIGGKDSFPLDFSSLHSPPDMAFFGKFVKS